MDLEQRLRASLVAPDPGPTFTARVLARVGHGAARRRSSFIVIGTVLVVSAAAAMLAWQMSAVPPPVESAAIPAVSDRKSVVEVPVMQAIPEVGEPVAAASEPASIPAQQHDISPQYSVLVMPLRQEADLSKRAPVEALYAATVDELRKVPGLTLRLSGESERGADIQADYVLTITSLAGRVLQSGGIMVRSADGSTDTLFQDGAVATFQRDGSGGSGGISRSNGRDSGDLASAVWVEMRAESGRSAASRQTLPVDATRSTSNQADVVDLNIIPSNLLSRMAEVTGGASTTYGSGAMTGVTNLVLNNRLTGFNVDMDYGSDGAGDSGGPRTTPAQPAAAQVKVLRVQLFALDAAFLQRCNSPTAVRPPECMTPAQQAATQVQILRLQVFPPDAAFQQNVVAGLGDARLDQAGGMRLLQDLLQGLTSDGGSRLDAGTIHALVRYAAGQAAGPRMYVWNMLRQASHPALVAPLVESLRHDADQQVRLAALLNLDANYSSDPGVRSALERIGREDPDGVVRVAVRRALYGQTQWRDEVLVALHDTTLPYEARLAPLLASGPAVSPRQQEYRRAALQEPQVLRPLIAFIREHLRDSAHAKATSDVLGVLGRVDDPAVFDLFVQLMRESPLLTREISVSANAVSMSGPITGWVFNHRGDPRVVAGLPDADPRLRSLVEQMAQPRSLPAPPMQIEPMIPSNLIQRMKEVVEKPVSPTPLQQ